MYNSKPLLIYFGNYDLLLRNAAGNRVFNNTLILKNQFRVINVFFTKTKNFTLNSLNIYNENFEIFPLSYPKSWFEWLNFLPRLKLINNAFINNDSLKSTHFIFYHSLFPSIITFFIILKLKFKKIKVIFDLVEFDYSLNKNIVLRFFKSVDLFISDKLIPRLGDGLIVISERLKNYFRKKKSLIVPPLNDFKALPLIEKSFHFPLKIIFSGSIGDFKSKEFLKKDRIDLIVELFRSNANVILDIYGISKFEYLSYFPKFELAKNVNFFGKIPHEEVIANYSNYDYSIIYRESTSKNNFGFPTKFAESFALGIPVITTDFSDLKKYIIEGINGFFLPNGFLKAKEKFDRIILKGPETSKNLRINLQQNNYFSIYRFEKSLISFIKEI